MTLRLITEAEAEFEWNQAVDYYEKQESGTGLRFNGIVQEYLRKIVLEHDRFPFASGLTQKCKITDWPYSIYFVFNQPYNEIKILAVWHGSRNPAELRRRLK